MKVIITDINWSGRNFKSALKGKINSVIFNELQYMFLLFIGHLLPEKQALILCFSLPTSTSVGKRTKLALIWPPGESKSNNHCAVKFSFYLLALETSGWNTLLEPNISYYRCAIYTFPFLKNEGEENTVEKCWSLGEDIDVWVFEFFSIKILFFSFLHSCLIFGIKKVLQGLIKILCSRCVCLLKKQSNGICPGRWELPIQLQLIPHWITGVINGLFHRVTRGCVIKSKEMTGVEIETERVTLIVTSWLSGALGSQIQRGQWNRRNGGRQGKPGCAFV